MAGLRPRRMGVSIAVSGVSMDVESIGRPRVIS